MQHFKSTFLFILCMLAGSLSAQTIKLNDPDSNIEIIKQIALAEQALAQEEYDKVAFYLEDYIGQQENKRIYNLVLDSYLAQEKYDKAEELVKEYQKKFARNDANYSVDLIYIYNKQGRSAKADDIVAETLKDVEKRPQLAYSLANVFQQKGYPKIALEIYETAQAKQPRMNFDYQMALIYGELGDIKKMYGMYVDMVARNPGYQKTVEQLLARALDEDESEENKDYLKEQIIRKIQEGGNQNLNQLLAFVYIKQENYRAAFLQLKALEKCQETNKSEIFNLGKVASKNGAYADAIRVFDYIADVGPESPYYEDALVQRLQAKSAILESEKATTIDDYKNLREEYLQVIEELKGSKEVATLGLELAHMEAFKLNEPDTAIMRLRKWINSAYLGNENIARLKIMLGDVLLYSGDRWEAILFYAQAEKAFEQSPIGQEAKFKRARAAYFVGDFKWALGIFDALKASTSKLIANDALHYALLINNNMALDTTTTAIEIYAQADLMHYQSKTDSALVLLDKLIKRFPLHTIQDEALLLRADIYANEANYEAAKADLMEILENHKDGILVDDALSRWATLEADVFGDQSKASELWLKLFTEHPDSFFAAEARKKYRQLRGDVLN